MIVSFYNQQDLLWVSVVMVVQVLRWQCFIVLALAFVAYVFEGKVAALSVFFSGLSVFFPNMVFSLNAFSFRKNTSMVMVGLLLKPILSLLLLALTAKTIAPLNWIWFYVGLIATLMAIKVSFLFNFLLTFINKD